MHGDYALFWPWVIAGSTVFLIYRRLRRSFGTQPVYRVRMWIRICVLSSIGAAMLPRAMTSAYFGSAETIGLGAGIALAVWAASRTRYLYLEARFCYVPHTFTGVAVSLLFVGRLAYRLAQLDLWHTQPTSLHAGNASAAYHPSPLTVGMLDVLVGYYVTYYGVVLCQASRHASTNRLKYRSTNQHEKSISQQTQSNQ